MGGVTLSLAAAVVSPGCDLGSPPQVLLFGGSTAPDRGIRADTWIWDGDWRPVVSSADAPAARAGHAMAYDTHRGRVLLFGGCTGRDCFEVAPAGDTWLFDQGQWEPSAAAAPDQVNYHAMAYDRRRDRVVLFGGYLGGGTGEGPDGGPDVLRELWEWDGESWESRGLGPTVGGVQMVYDSRRQLIVVFDGRVIFEWTGVTWREWAPEVAPPFRRDPAMAYDEARGVTVLYGGYFNGHKDDTWEWDGESWQERLPFDRPAVRSPEMAWAPDLGRVVLFGTSAVGADWNQVWIWDGENWEERPPSSCPPHRSNTAIVGL